MRFEVGGYSGENLECRTKDVSYYPSVSSGKTPRLTMSSFVVDLSPSRSLGGPRWWPSVSEGSSTPTSLGTFVVGLFALLRNPKGLYDHFSFDHLLDLKESGSVTLGLRGSEKLVFLYTEIIL